MHRNVGQYYLSHFHMTAGTPSLLARALQRALVELHREDVVAFAHKMAQIRRSLRFDGPQGQVAAALARVFAEATRKAQLQDYEGAQESLALVLAACSGPAATSSRPAA